MHTRKVTCETLEQIAKDLSVSPRSVQRHYQKARKEGLLGQWLLDIKNAPNVAESTPGRDTTHRVANECYPPSQSAQMGPQPIPN